ncbi:MAG: hypothetical protein ACK5LX_11075 [Oscillospiraceae bacterium]
MESVVGKLLDIDQRAYQLLDEAKQYHEKTIREIAEEKAALEARYQEHADSHLENVRHTEELAAAEQAGEIDRRYDALAKELEAAYDSGHEAWEDELFKRITE